MEDSIVSLNSSGMLDVEEASPRASPPRFKNLLKERVRKRCGKRKKVNSHG
jgi:hypothetical protein